VQTFLHVSTEVCRKFDRPEPSQKRRKKNFVGKNKKVNFSAGNKDKTTKFSPGET